eukprot:CAMPEP_0172528464 /NCGR_PEP_ID=MMETSP1067-20121228/2857_1 /TAXON_ID=265564 ORGANISM="Thalassiosira punctigera, Strain Tpunct2005C2" /NCGR_SAMPLE_ID=MMETSP1067 /ASSEMBLY_ACC=CAM_ASM_000444 /LENGTH=208 /DNA_ID=CAMNT_0013312375 /DNA_START=16 /DNA_END=642 /DNA_ORIENTATION=-
MVSPAFALITVVALVAAALPLAAAFAVPVVESGFSAQSTIRKTVLHATTQDPSRRAFLANNFAAAAASVTVSSLLPIEPVSAADDKESLIADLTDSLAKIQTIPPLVESAEWDKIRTILKTPPVNELWNLGESKNTLVKLAKETGEFELVEMKDELAISLQMTDQYSYDNNFIYYQPGNGKIKTKEPLQMAEKAISQLKDALAVVNSS